MRAILLSGNQPNQMALSHKLAQVCELVAVVVSDNIPAKQKPLVQRAHIFANRVAGRLIGGPLIDAWFFVMNRYGSEYRDFPAVPRVRVRNVNDEQTLKVLDSYAPDVVIVSGTNLVGRKIVESAQRKLGILNLHTGISPYVKGGPNCTNWCLAERWFHLIGNTAMWLDLGIDTGSIVATEQTPLTGHETLRDLHWKVMEHGQSMYVAAVQALARGETVPRISQNSISEGHTFCTREWSAGPMLRAMANFRHYYNPAYFTSEEYRQKSAELKLLPLRKTLSSTRACLITSPTRPL